MTRSFDFILGGRLALLIICDHWPSYRNTSQSVKEGLHILSLALEVETNQSDVNLWLAYLKLYRKQKPKDREDYSDVCEKALVKLPTYDIFILVCKTDCRRLRIFRRTSVRAAAEHATCHFLF